MAKERKNPGAPRKVRSIRERGYFHTGNSGISISLVEEYENYDWDVRDRNWYNHYLEVRHSAFGAGTSIRTPIAGPAMCDYYIEAFTRLKEHMAQTSDYTVPNPFDRYDPQSKCNDIHRVVDYENGVRREAVWSEEMVVDESSTETVLLGYNYVDPVTDKVVRYQAHEGPKVATGSGGTEAIYPIEAIGKTVAEAKEMIQQERHRLKVLAGIEKPVKPQKGGDIEKFVNEMTSVSREFSLAENIDQEDNLQELLATLNETVKLLSKEIGDGQSVNTLTETMDLIKRISEDNRIDELVEEVNEASKEIDTAPRLENVVITSNTSAATKLARGLWSYVGQTVPINFEKCIYVVNWLREKDSNAIFTYENSESKTCAIPVDASGLIPNLIADQMSDSTKSQRVTVTITDEEVARQFASEFSDRAFTRQ